MSDRIERLAAGFYVIGTPHREHSYSHPTTPRVTVRRPDGCLVHMTPDDARALANVLLDEADHAANGGYRG